MSNDDARLGHAVREALAAAVDPLPLPRIKSPVSSGRGLSARLGALEKAHGGPAGAAAAIGVTLRTYAKWGRGVRPARRSLGLVDDAYEADVRRREAAQEPARRRERLRQMIRGSESFRAHLKLWAEFQCDGYYNGEAKQKGATVGAPYPPLPENGAAFRGVNLGSEDWAPLLGALGLGDAAAGRLLETICRQVFHANPTVFPNSYHHAPQLEVTPS